MVSLIFTKCNKKKTVSGRFCPFLSKRSKKLVWQKILSIPYTIFFTKYIFLLWSVAARPVFFSTLLSGITSWSLMTLLEEEGLTWMTSCVQSIGNSPKISDLSQSFENNFAWCFIFFLNAFQESKSRKSLFCWFCLIFQFLQTAPLPNRGHQLPWPNARGRTGRFGSRRQG